MAIDPKVFKQVRKALGLSQQELADALGLSRVTVNKMERGRLRRGIPDEVAERLLALQKRPATPWLLDSHGRVVGPQFKPLLTEEYRKDLDDAAAKLWNKGDDAHLWDNEEDDQ